MAVPVRVSVAVVALALTKEAVSPAGTLLTVPRATPFEPVKVSPVRVIVILFDIVPSFARVSVNVVEL